MAPQLRFRLPDEERAIQRIVETEHVNYETAKRRLAEQEKKSAPRAESAPAHWIGNEED